MKSILKTEEIAVTLVAVYFLSLHDLGLSFWIWLPLFFSPDISMLGYLFGNKIGAVCYNIFHHQGIAILLAACGYFWNAEILLSVGILLFAHSSFDRIMGYGLKYFSGFQHTHLGNIGKQRSTVIKSASDPA